MTVTELEPLFEHTRLCRRKKERGSRAEQSEERRALLPERNEEDLPRCQKLARKIEKKIPDIRGPSDERIGVINFYGRYVGFGKELAEAYVHGSDAKKKSKAD